MKRHRYGIILAGLSCGIVNGLFGAGGGMVLVPLLTALAGLEDRTVFSSSIVVMIPICLVSIAATALSGTICWRESIPWLISGAAGGIIAGKWGEKIPVLWLHRGLGLLILYGGVRYLC